MLGLVVVGTVVQGDRFGSSFTKGWKLCVANVGVSTTTPCKLQIL